MTDTVLQARMVGINHVALEVGDLGEALEFYGQLFELKFRNRFETIAFLDMGDQFLAIAEGNGQGPDDGRHFGLVVDDKELVRARLESVGVQLLATAGLEFLDPWGNRIQIVEYSEIQFAKLPSVLRGMGLVDLTKSETAEQELRDKGMAPD